MRTRVVETMIYAPNERAWAIGTIERGRLRIRKIVWGRLLARMEKREGEVIRRALVLLTGN